MKNKRTVKVIAYLAITISLVSAVVLFHDIFLYFTSQAVVYCAKTYLPQQGVTLPAVTSQVHEEETTVKESTTTAETTTKKSASALSSKAEDFTATPDDILKAIAERKKTADSDKKDGSIKEKQYKNDGVTHSFGRVRVKNVNKTGIDIENILGEKIDLSVSKDKPSVLIFHTHTTETYQLLDRGFYETGFLTRTKDSAKNMVRVGKAICEEIEKAGYGVIHDTEIHDSSYNGAYAHSRKAIEAILKENPSIQVVLDIHRDAIQLSDGTKIKPTAEIGGKKAAQIMIISGCQEEGNPITNLPDWRYNLTFAVHLQDKLEELFSGITRPLYFCPRSYNMNVTHCSLLVEVGSDANTLEEAVYTGKCIGKALSEILKEYEEK
ncbi:MAG: stage II sporulation protein P [Clostridia bacterium]|nr:stage II sporulation protein P [Clostridia bacterium]